MVRNSRILKVLFLVLALVAAGCGDDSDDEGPAAAPEPTTTSAAGSESEGDDADAEWAEVEAAAKEEGSVVFYSGQPEAQLQLIADGFEEAYGIEVQFQRIVGPELAPRYSAEAESGSPVADVLFTASNAYQVSEEWADEGWITPLEEAGLPALEDGTYPEEFLYNGIMALAGIQPWGIAYNTDLVDAADAPTSFEELADPTWRGKMVAADPTASNAYLSAFTAIRDEYGDEWFEGFRANEPTYHAAGTPAGQSLGAGEASLLAMTAPSLVFELKNSGAPVELNIPDLTAGVEAYVLMTSVETAEHPNAARLLANWLLTEEGGTAANDFPGSYSVFDQDLPSEFQSYTPDELITQEELAELLGR